jgi:hypothetical protein
MLMNIFFFGQEPPFPLVKIKKAELPLFKATRLSHEDPWFSVPALQQVWLYLSSVNILFLCVKLSSFYK